MSPALLQGIRSHFARAATATVYEGSCVGVELSLLTAMAQVCGGSIEVDSELGFGTTVRVLFPWPPVCSPWFRQSPTVRSVLRPLDEFCRDLTVSSGRFYGLDLTVIDDLAMFGNLPNADVFQIDCRDDGQTLEWLRQACDEKGMFERQMIACLSPTEILMNRQVERFIPPLKPDDRQRYLHQIALGKVGAHTA
jgi:hypothetical protein